MTARKSVVVSVGTYHLPFNRLIDWTQPWVTGHPDVDVFVQHGPSQPVAGAENVEILPYAELLRRCEKADAIVLQGGAGGVMDMRALDRIPIVVPRVPQGHEVVDTHQLLFTAEMEAIGIIHRVTTRAALWERLDDALAGRIPTRSTHAAPTPGVERVTQLLEAPPGKLHVAARIRREIRSVRNILTRSRHAL